jgi:hypothetical protein
MQRLQYSLLAAAGILILAFVLNLVGPKRVMAALGYTPIREVNAPGRQPFSIRLDVPTMGAIPGGTFPVPANKRLVITYIDSTAVGDAAVRLVVNSSVNGLDSGISIPFSTARGGLASLNQQVMGFADPGTTVSVFYISTAADQARVNLHGYYVDVP